MKIIDNAANKNIPTKRVQYYVHPQESDYIRLLEEQYKQLRATNNWTREQLDILKNIQDRIKEESSRLYNDMWNTKIREINDIYIETLQHFGEG